MLNGSFESKSFNPLILHSSLLISTAPITISDNHGGLGAIPLSFSFQWPVTSNLIIPLKTIKAIKS